MGWLEDKIEEPIRGLVKLLRDNGFNTFSSCGHEMQVDMEWYKLEDLSNLSALLLSNGYEKFVIETSWIFFEDTSEKQISLRIS